MAAQGAEIDLEDQQTLKYIKSMDQLAFVHETLGSGFLLVIAGIGMTLFAGGDFSSGYIKNICFARPRRWDYVLSKLLLAGVYSGLLTALGVLLSLLSPRLVGLRLAAAPLSQLTGYAVLMWLPCWAFSLMALTLVLLTRSSTLGIILSLVSGGDLTVILAGALCGRLGLPPDGCGGAHPGLRRRMERPLCRSEPRGHKKPGHLRRNPPCFRLCF